MTGLSLVVKRSFNMKNWPVPRTEAAIVVGAEEEGGGWARGQKASFFAGGEELQGFLEVLDGCAYVFVLQGAAGVLAELLRLSEVLRRELDATCGEDRRRWSSQRSEPGGGSFSYGHMSNICSPDLATPSGSESLKSAAGVQQVCKHGVTVGVLHPSSSPEQAQHLLRRPRVKASGFIYIPLFSTRSSICPSGRYRPPTFCWSSSWRKPKTSHFLFLIRARSSPVMKHHLLLGVGPSSSSLHQDFTPPIKPVWFHRRRSPKLRGEADKGGGQEPQGPGGAGLRAAHYRTDDQTGSEHVVLQPSSPEADGKIPTDWFHQSNPFYPST